MLNGTDGEGGVTIISSTIPTVRQARSTGRMRTSVSLSDATARKLGIFMQTLEHSTCYSTLPAKMLFFGVNEK